MKLRHHVPNREPQSAVLTPHYQAEVDRTMARAEAAWKKAKRNLDRAEHRLAKARKAHRPKAQIGHLEMLVELRRVELEQLHRLMVATGFPSTARGIRSHRHVSTGGVL